MPSVILAVVTALLVSFAVVTFESFIFEVSTASSAISETVMVPSTILAEVTASLASFVVVMAPEATAGKSAVPVKSPANFSFPFVVASASAMVAEAI